VSVEEVKVVGGEGGGKEGKEKKEGREEKRREKIGGEEGKWSNRGLRELVFGQNGRGR
jgi:hypothetical protein